ncbi:hypothetical protein SLS56_009164 [Neofusicoccum ribis]|uniref:C6 transcription factor n=1 Tax=Neofusicoccum ribis TaxID=45134 RepID=A0ABR3SI61_9PEZI
MRAVPSLLASRTATPAATSTGPSSTPTEQPAAPSAGPSSPALCPVPSFAHSPGHGLPQYSIAELELLHNYHTSTAQSLSSNPVLFPFWRVDVPKISFGWPCLLNGLFSVSALHLAHFRPESRHHYLAQADVYWDLALRSATPLLESIDDSNCHATYVFSILAAFYLLGKGPRPGDFLAFDAEGTAGTLLHTRATRIIIESNSEVLRNGPAAVPFDVGIRCVSWWSLPDPAGEHALVQELRFILAYLEDSHRRAGSDDVYRAEIDNLSRSYHAVAAERSAVGRVSTQAIFVWLYRLSDEFLDCLRQHEPMALTIFAYFVVLLKELDIAWYLHGWVTHLISGIHHALSPGTRTWIRTPIERIGWIPPTP